MFDTEEKVKNLYLKYKDELFCGHFKSIETDENGWGDGGISHVDGQLLYILLRELDPRFSIEFSPNCGYSTAFICEALRKNHRSEAVDFATFDINRCANFDIRMRRLGFSPNFILGDAIIKVPEFLNNIPVKPKFCFIDSEHGGYFANAYLDHIIPLLSTDCIIAIHDMCCAIPNDINFTHYGFVAPFQICGTRAALEERDVLAERILPYYNIISTHRIFGDWHEDSPKLPRNMNLINWLREISGGQFVLDPTQSSGNDIPRPPMSIILLPK